LGKQQLPSLNDGEARVSKNTSKFTSSSPNKSSPVSLTKEDKSNSFLSTSKLQEDIITDLNRRNFDDLFELSQIALRNLIAQEDFPVKSQSHNLVESNTELKKEANCVSCDEVMCNDPSSKELFFCKNQYCNFFMIPLEKADLCNSAMNEKLNANFGIRDGASTRMSNHDVGIDSTDTESNDCDALEEDDGSFSDEESKTSFDNREPKIFIFPSNDEDEDEDEAISINSQVEMAWDLVNKDRNIVDLIDHLASAAVTGSMDSYL